MDPQVYGERGAPWERRAHRVQLVKTARMENLDPRVRTAIMEHPGMGDTGMGQMGSLDHQVLLEHLVRKAPLGKTARLALQDSQDGQRGASPAHLDSEVLPGNQVHQEGRGLQVKGARRARRAALAPLDHRAPPAKMADLVHPDLEARLGPGAPQETAVDPDRSDHGVAVGLQDNLDREDPLDPLEHQDGQQVRLTFLPTRYISMT